jgi:formylglycine-generating enzyme required for sulfatase activity
VRWYVHLKADRRWVEVAGEIRFEVSTKYTDDGHELYSTGFETLPLELDLRAPPAAPRQLWWADTSYVANARVLVTPSDQADAFRHSDLDATSPWLDPILSHAAVPRCVVVGPAGTGKTVLLQHLAWVLATAEGSGNGAEPVHRVDRAGLRCDSPVPPVPILHTASTLVAHLRGDRPIREALVALLRSSETFGDIADPATVRAGIDAGRYVFLIDSLDEVPRRQDRVALVAALGTLTGPTPRVILTTRPSPHTAVELPDGFVRVDIAPLDRDTVTRLTRAWVSCWAPSTDVEQVLRAIEHVGQYFPAQSDERSPIENPLLLSCILQVYALYQRLPDDTAKLYYDMVRVLCEAKLCAVDDLERDSLVERYREALRELFLATQELGGTRLGLAPACELLVQRGLAARGTAESWLQALANHTGLLRFDGAGDAAMIRPWHRSYQEYLAAEKVALDYANRASECVDWLRTPRGQHGPRLTDPAWRGTLRFLIGAAAHHNRAWAVNLIDAMATAAATREPDQARLHAFATEAAAEYASSLLQNEGIRQTLPGAVTRAFTTDGKDWPVAERLTILDALGRLGDPRLADPRLRDRGPDPGWIEVPAGTYPTGTSAALSDEDRRNEARDNKDQRTTPAQAKNWAAWRDNRVLALTMHPTVGFWIRRWPVTVAEFLPFIDNPPTDLVFPMREIDWSILVPGWRAQARYPTRPIVDVSWYVARAFCRWAQWHWSLPCDGLIDLPTSLEWEIAARRHTNRRYPWGNEPPGEGDTAAAAYLWKAKAVSNGATPVGAFPRGHTPEGLWDMGGNISEWCASIHAGRSGNDAADHDLPINCSDPIPPCEVVYRGGSWRGDAPMLAVAYRGDSPPSMTGDYIGFRVVCRCPSSSDATSRTRG